jgi:tetratricopeptide (TPR) repeat protein
MRTLLTAALALGVGLASAGAVRAGAYNTAEPLLFPGPWNFNQFESVLGELRLIPVERREPPSPNPIREHYLKQVADLEAKRRSVGLTVRDQVNLGAYYIHLLRYEEAARVLETAQAEEPGNFMALANLATAQYLAGPQDPARLSRAIEYQQQALKAWPSIQAGFTGEELAFNRRAERYFLSLLQLRQQEARLQAGRGDQAPDDLFHVRFVGPGGRYEAGMMAPDQMDRLPLESIPLVEQLLLWLPLDNRLYWLLAELRNAKGDVEGASKIMDELVSNQRRYRPPELWAHRQAVLRAWQDIQKVARVFDGTQGPSVTEQLFWTLAPRGGVGAPGIGAGLHETSWAAALVKIDQNNRFAPPNPAPADTAASAPAAANPPPSSASWMPDWRPFLVGLATGVALTLLIGLQVRQNRAARKGGKTQGVH